MKKVAEREHFANFHIAGFTFYDGVLVFEKLKIGSELTLVPEPTNRFDKNAVILYYGEHKVGYIPRSTNREISKLLNAGYNPFRAFVQMVNPKVDPESQIKVVVFIEKKSK